MSICSGISHEGLLNHSFAGAVQVASNMRERQSTSHAASTPTASPDPAQVPRSGSRRPKLPNRPTPSSAGAQSSTQAMSASGQDTIAGSHAKPDEEQRSTPAESKSTSDEGQPSGPIEPKSGGKGNSRVEASPGRRAGRKPWSCARCKSTAEMLEGAKLQECTGCRSVRYCGRACQKEDWPAHKATCKRLQAVRAQREC
jgi:hypothetical protein